MFERLCTATLHLQRIDVSSLFLQEQKSSSCAVVQGTPRSEMACSAHAKTTRLRRETRNL
eukprot:SAG11_NODE_11793_length_738_cov_0.762128_1_plen_59_part_10